MDGDLQDPPELIPTLVERWQEGYEVVYTVRNQRKEGLAKRFAYATFYRLLQRITDIDIPLDSGDFCLMDRRAVDLLVRLPERNRFLRGLRSWLGFRQVAVEYDRPARFAGEPKYTAAQLVNLAANGIFSFSEAPLRLTRNAGLVITIGSALIAAWTLLKRLILYEVVPGFATLAILVLFFGGVQLITVGILGEYIARIYSEVKGRPLYIVQATEGVEVRDTSHR
jgi:dolichol-phosphate mannosyltransferase